MSVDELLEHIPPVARYRREPLDEADNALYYWDQAASVMVELDDDVAGTDACSSTTRLVATDHGRQFLADNLRTFELLHEGVCCDRIQFPELEEEGGSVGEHAQSLSVLGELAQAWSLLARSQIVQDDPAAAAAELVALGRMGPHPLPWRGARDALSHRKRHYADGTQRYSPAHQATALQQYRFRVSRRDSSLES